MTSQSRRSFLKNTALVPMLSPVFLLGSLSKAYAPSQNSLPQWISKARSDIPATKNPFFQTAGIGPSPRSVMDVVSQNLHFQNDGPVDPSIYDIISKIEPNLRKKIAEMFGAFENEIALTHSTSEGINIASWSINWKKNDEVLITNQEHPANIIPWYSLSKRFGLKIKRLNFNSDSNIVHEIKKNISRRTRMISIPHVSRNNGRALTLQESKEIASYARKRNIRYHLDGAQGPLCVDFNFHLFESDYYSTCGHKWILAPKGTGIFFCREEILDDTMLTWTGSHSHTTMDQNGNYELIPEARRFEFGTRALATFAGFEEALKWNEKIGINKILTRIDELTVFAINEWSQRGFKVSSPISEGSRSGVFVIELPQKMNGWNVYNRLRNDKSIFTSPVDSQGDLRIAIHFFNTKSEISDTFELIQNMS